jgi:hypothetical protein
LKILLSLLAKVTLRSRRFAWRPSDIFICSYPKAGISYLTFILTNVYILKFSPDESVANYYTVDDYIPDLHSPLYNGNSKIEPRLIKTHENAEQFLTRINALGSGALLPRVILLTRDPHKSVPSYYNYLQALGVLRNNDFDSFTAYLKKMGRDWFFWQSSWSRYFVSHPKGFIKIQYEDLISDPIDTVYEICKFVGWDVSSAIVTEAMQLSSREKMKELEDKQGDGMVYAKEFSFAAERKQDQEIDIAYKKITDYLFSKK